MTLSMQCCGMCAPRSQSTNKNGASPFKVLEDVESKTRVPEERSSVWRKQALLSALMLALSFMVIASPRPVSRHGYDGTAETVFTGPCCQQWTIMPVATTQKLLCSDHKEARALYVCNCTITATDLHLLDPGNSAD